VAEGIPEHPECFGRVTPQHHPKKGMGGNNPKSRVVAYLCIGIHDAIDNISGKYQGRRWGNEVVNGEYRIFDRDTREILLSVPSL
jgi:hypothetical protein